MAFPVKQLIILEFDKQKKLLKNELKNPTNS